MDMTSSNSTTTAMMVPWLHFTGGDHLIFEAWHPSSPGAIAGACIGLFLFAMFERWVNGMRGRLDMYWRKRAMVLMSTPVVEADACHDPALATEPVKSDDVSNEVQEVKVGKPSSIASLRRTQRPPRSLPPFIPSHDIPRGALFALQALLYYVLMLAVMTFQAGFIISIIIGLAVGEILFGRLGAFKSHFSH